MILGAGTVLVALLLPRRENAVPEEPAEEGKLVDSGARRPSRTLLTLIH
ncbi:hypothetical protein ACWCQN_27645 [Streptomyces sp. NPDC001984]